MLRETRLAKHPEAENRSVDAVSGMLMLNVSSSAAERERHSRILQFIIMARTEPKQKCI
jgi:hypothetical protein